MPGWYPDPTGKPMQRYFDGNQWTEHYAAAGTSPAPRPAPPSAAKNLMVFAIILVVIVAGLGGIVLLSKTSSDDQRTTSTEEPTPMGRPAADGKFSFTVTEFKKANWYGNGVQGVVYIATIRVSNTGNEPQSFFISNQKLVDSQGREYAPSTDVSYELNKSTVSLDMNPGFSMDVRVPFDIPPSATPEWLELHDSALSGGVAMRVS